MLRAAFGATTLCVLVLCSATASADGPEAASGGDLRSLIPHARLGPMVGVGFPGGASVGLTAKVHEIVVVGADFEAIPSLAIPGVSGAKLARVGGQGYLRLYPFRGAFFVGVGMGYEQMKGSATKSVDAYDTTTTAVAAAYVHTLYVAPHVGWLWTWDMGLAIGFDVGVELPIATTSPTFDVSSYGLNVHVDGTGALADAMRYASHRPMPIVNPLKVAFLF